MCYTQRDRSSEEEARRLRAGDDRRERGAEDRRQGERGKKPVADRVRETVGAK